MKLLPVAGPLVCIVVLASFPRFLAAKDASGQIWRTLLNSPADIDSEVDEQGQFEIHVYRFDPHDVTRALDIRRIQANFSPSQAHVFFLDPLGLPVLAGDRQTAAALATDVRWKISDGAWQVDAAAEHAGQMFLTDSTQASGKIRLDVGSVLRMLFEKETVEHTWSRANLTLTAVRSSGSICRVRLRSPNDQLRFGTLTAGLEIAKGDGSLITRFDALDKTGSSVQFVPLREAFAQKDLKSACDDVDRPQWDYVNLHRADQVRSAALLWQAVTGFQTVDVSQLDAQADFAAGLTLKQQAAYLANVSLSNLEDKESYLQLVEALTAVLKGIADVASQANDYPLAVDDPVMIWRDAERGIGNQELAALTALAQRLMTHPQATRTTQVLLADQLASLGPIPFDGHGEFYRTISDDPILAAIFQSGYLRPCEPSQVEACVAVLQNDDSDANLQLAAVAALVQLDQVDSISPVALERWYASTVANAQSPTTRTRAITQLTFEPSGRRYLIGRIQTAAPDRSEVRRQIIDALLARVAAAKKLKRDDFLSPAECAEIEAVVEQTQEVAGAAARDRQ